MRRASLLAYVFPVVLATLMLASLPVAASPCVPGTGPCIAIQEVDDGSPLVTTSGSFTAYSQSLGPESATITFQVLPTGMSTGNPGLILFEPNSTVFSDALVINAQANPTGGVVNVALNFVSDPLPRPNPAGQSFMNETGTDLDVTTFWKTENIFLLNFGLFVSSEIVEHGDPVPEPTSLLLLGSGLAGLAGRVAWRQRRRG